MKLRPTAISAEAVCAYQLLITFDNGEKKYFDVEPYIKGEWYGKLRLYEYFKRVTTDGYTVVWPDGQDICPDELYDFGKQVSSLKAILLNGASSSGKSTLAKALQAALKDRRNEEYAIVSIDDFLTMTAEEPIYEDDVFEISPELTWRVSSLLNAGQGVIIDHAITSERIYEQLIRGLRGYDLIRVQITCLPEELEKREKLRGDRHAGSAKASLEYLYPKDGYDLCLDTCELSPEACCEKLLILLSNMA